MSVQQISPPFLYPVSDFIEGYFIHLYLHLRKSFLAYLINVQLVFVAILLCNSKQAFTLHA